MLRQRLPTEDLWQWLEGPQAPTPRGPPHQAHPTLCIQPAPPPIPGMVPLVAMKSAMSTGRLSTCRSTHAAHKLPGADREALRQVRHPPPSSRGPVRSRALAGGVGRQGSSQDMRVSGVLPALPSLGALLSSQGREAPPWSCSIRLLPKASLSPRLAGSAPTQPRAEG